MPFERAADTDREPRARAFHVNAEMHALIPNPQKPDEVFNRIAHARLVLEQNRQNAGVIESGACAHDDCEVGAPRLAYGLRDDFSDDGDGNWREGMFKQAGIDAHGSQ
jgi:hypothetical protein